VRITARASGWQWRTPLQANASVGHVYASAFQDDEAARLDLAAFAGPTLLEPRLVSFTNGRRSRFWDRNVLALGTAAGFLESLAGTDSYLLGNQLFNMLDHFPDRDFDPALIASYNAAVGNEFERIRDFLLLHYACSRRSDTPFWLQRREVELPATLSQRLEIYRATGRIVQRGPDAFGQTRVLEASARRHDRKPAVPQHDSLDHRRRSFGDGVVKRRRDRADRGS
jgi:tryptophan halogenase